MHLFAQLSKIDIARHEVWGVATAEVVDKDGEIFDYESSKPHFQSWSDEIAKATDGRSLGNVREMHAPSAVGKLVALEFDDQLKQIRVGAKIVDAAAWQKCTLGVYTGFSIGGSYVKTWSDGQFTRFTACPVEISVVDNPCVPGAHFTAIKTDGTTELRKFQSTGVTWHSDCAPVNCHSERSEESAVANPRLTPPSSSPNESASDPSNLRPSAASFSSSSITNSPGAPMPETQLEPSLSAVHKDLADLRAEIASTNQELEKSLANLIALMEKIVSPNPSGAKLARTAVPGVTLRKEDDSTSPEKPETPGSVHELLKLALQNPQRAANYLR
jgi:hypothetical protein